MQLLPFDYGYSQCQVRYSGANNSAAGKHDTYMYIDLNIEVSLHGVIVKPSYHW